MRAETQARTMVGAGRRSLEVLRRTQRDDDRGVVHEAELSVPTDLLYFRGHFEDDPLLPGVAQIDLAVLVEAETAWPELVGQLRGVSRLKFLKPILPGHVLKVTLLRGEDRARVDFTIHCGDSCCSLGTLTFELPEGR